MDTTIPEVRAYTKEEFKSLKHALAKINGATKSVFFKKLFGCDTCPYRGTETCPHNIKEGEKHANGICTFRANELKELYETAGSIPRLFQQDAIVKSQVLLDHFRDEYALTGKLHPNFHQLEKNLIGLLDKVRKQDEGIKIHGEITVTHDKLRQIIDVQAERVKVGENVREAEVAEGNKQQVKNASIFRNRQDTEL